MKLISMKIDAAEAKKMTEPSSPKDLPRFPWGLGLNLDTAVLEKLEIDELPKVGEVYMLMAKVEVTGINISEHQQGDPCKSLSLQITDMALVDGTEKKDAAAALYK